MQIVHRVEDFLYELFPAVKDNCEHLSILPEEVARYCTYRPYNYILATENGWLSIHIQLRRAVAENSTPQIEIDRTTFAQPSPYISHPLEVEKKVQKIPVRAISQFAEESIKVVEL